MPVRPDRTEAPLPIPAPPESVLALLAPVTLEFTIIIAPIPEYEGVSELSAIPLPMPAPPPIEMPVTVAFVILNRPSRVSAEPGAWME
jgi:hypothetical protein